MKKLYRFLVFTTLIFSLLLAAALPTRAEATVDYDALFTRALTDDSEEFEAELEAAFFQDALSFMRELSYWDAQTKQAVIDIFCSNLDQYSAMIQQISNVEIYMSGQGGQGSRSEREFCTVFKRALVYQRASLAHDYRDIPVLFDEIMTVNEIEAYGFSDELAYAGIANPAELIRLLAKEDDSVQERALSFLWSQYYTFLGTFLKEKLTEIRETEDFTAEELALLDTIVGYYVDSPTVPVPADPYPEDLEAWLAKKNPQATEPSETDPPPEESDPLPTETDPLPEQTDPADPEPTQPAQQEADGRTWIWIVIGVCVLGAVGFVMGKRFNRHS